MIQINESHAVNLVLNTNNLDLLFANFLKHSERFVQKHLYFSFRI